MKLVTKIFIGAIILAAVFFYSGLKYSAGQLPPVSATAGTTFAGRSGTSTFARSGAAGGAVSGTLLSIEPEGITVSVTGNGSKIVFIASSTSVMTTSAGSINDLKVGENVSVTGQTNSDGSITARSIDVRPALTAAGN